MPFDKSKFLQFVDDDRYTLLQRAIKIDCSNAVMELVRVPPQTAAGSVSYSYASTSVTGILNQTVSCFNNGATHYIDCYFGSNYKALLSSCYVMIQYYTGQFRSNFATATTSLGSFFGVPIDPSSSVTLSSTIANTTGGTLQTAATGIVGSAVLGTGYSIPFEPGHLFDNVYLMSGASQSVIEQYTIHNQFRNIALSRHVLDYKREALEGAHDSFFTPCIESKFDDCTLSSESVTRNQKWLGSDGPSFGGSSFGGTLAATEALYKIGGTAHPNIPYQTKNIPLSDLFDCCKVPAYLCNSPKMRFQFTMITPDQVCFCANNTITPPSGGTYAAFGTIPILSTGSITYGINAQTQAQTNYNLTNGCSVPYFFVTQIQLYIDSSRTTPMQSVEIATDHKEMAMNNLGYLEHFPIPSIQSQQIVVTGQRDVQAVILKFEAYLSNTQVLGASGAVQNWLQADQGGLTSLQAMYGNSQNTKQPMQLDINNKYNNTIAYTNYRKNCNNDKNNLLANAIPFDRFWVYNLYCMHFFPCYSIHLQSDSQDIRMDNSPSANRNVVSIVRKFKGIQISSDGQVEMMN
jgi:hypothetical protein